MPLATSTTNSSGSLADSFKFRNKVGLDVATEALRDYRCQYNQGLNDLSRYAKIDGVDRVARPYLEWLSETLRKTSDYSVTTI